MFLRPMGMRIGNTLQLNTDDHFRDSQCDKFCRAEERGLDRATRYLSYHIFSVAFETD